jgi:hypothetical protein
MLQKANYPAGIGVRDVGLRMSDALRDAHGYRLEEDQQQAAEELEKIV